MYARLRSLTPSSLFGGELLTSLSLSLSLVVSFFLDGLVDGHTDSVLRQAIKKGGPGTKVHRPCCGMLTVRCKVHCAQYLWAIFFFFFFFFFFFYSLSSQYCNELNNFNCLMAVVVAFGTASLARLDDVKKVLATCLIGSDPNC